MKKFMIAVKVIATLFNLGVAMFLVAVVYFSDAEIPKWVLFLLLIPIINLLAIFGLGSKYRSGKVLKTVSILPYLGFFVFFVAVEGFPRFAYNQAEFFAFWGLVLWGVCNVIAIFPNMAIFKNPDFIKRIKANSHKMIQYAFMIVVLFLLVSIAGRMKKVDENLSEVRESMSSIETSLDFIRTLPGLYRSR